MCVNIARTNDGKIHLFLPKAALLLLLLQVEGGDLYVPVKVERAVLLALCRNENI